MYEGVRRVREGGEEARLGWRGTGGMSFREGKKKGGGCVFGARSVGVGER